MIEALQVDTQDATSAEAQALIQRLDAYLRERYPAQAIHGFHPDEIADAKGAFVVAWIGGIPVGCGAVRPLESDTAEVKRMYVEPTMRGKGIARAILRKLEAIAWELGFRVMRLETGTRQPEAIALYESSGYVRIPRFGEYANDPFSVCFEKKLSPRTE